MPLSTRILKPATLALMQRDVDVKAVQDKLDIAVDLSDGNGKVTGAQALRFFEHYLTYFLGAETSASIAYREHLGLDVFGPVGFAMITAPTVGQALATLVRHKQSVATELLADLTVELEQDRLVMQWTLGDHPKPVQDFVMEISLCFLNLGGQQLPPQDRSSAVERLYLAHRPKPDFIRTLEQDMPGVPVEYEQPRNELWCETRLLGLKPVAGNLETFNMLCEQLEQLSRMNLLQHDSAANELAKLLRECAVDGTFLNLQQAADRMHMSSRTLTRKLDKQASSFQMINDYIRADLACKMLRTGSSPVKSIAHRSGFSSEAGFSRAFRKWFQVTPLEYRSDPSLEVTRLRLTKANDFDGAP